MTKAKRKRHEQQQHLMNLAETAKKLRIEGNPNPTAEEIARRHHRRDALGSATYAEVRRALPRLCEIVAASGHPACLLGPAFYERDHEANPIASEADARQCIPLGRGNGAVGIHFFSEEDDLIWLATKTQNFASAAGKFRKNCDDLLEGVDEGRVTTAVAGGILRLTRGRMQPVRRELEAELVQALPEASEPQGALSEGAERA